MQLAGRAKPGSQGPLSPKEDREGLGGNRASGEGYVLFMV